MTKSQKVEYVINGVGESGNPSRWVYLLVSSLLSLVVSCKQGDGLVGLSFVSKHQKTAMSKSCKTHKSPTCTYDVFDLPVKAFCHGICTPIFPSVQNIGHTFVYRFCYRAYLRHASAFCDRHPSLQGKFHLIAAFIGLVRPFEEELEGKVGAFKFICPFRLKSISFTGRKAIL